jgi:chain length determinant protein (polysaccharide antigen chain regulator)
MGPMTIEGASAPMNDEIDVFELFESIWKERVLIVAITFVITLAGVGYVLSIPPTYRASVQMLPPSPSDIGELAKFDVLKFSQPQAFEDFLQTLNSNQLRKTFLSQEGVEATLFSREISSLEALIALEKMSALKRSKENPTTEVTFNFQFKDAAVAAEYANQIVQLAVDHYRADLAQTFASRRDQEVIKLEEERKSLISMHEGLVDREIDKLKEAYEIARELGLDELSKITNMMEGQRGRSSLITEELRYLYSQGKRALRAELKALSKVRESPDMIYGWFEIEQRLALLKSVSFDAAKVMPVTIDLAAEAPGRRIKPKRSLIVGLSAVSGGMLAIMFVLIRNAVRNRKTNA